MLFITQPNTRTLFNRLFAVVGRTTVGYRQIFLLLVNSWGAVPSTTGQMPVDDDLVSAVSCLLTLRALTYSQESDTPR